MWNRIGFMVIFSHLEGILNGALLLSLIVQQRKINGDDLGYQWEIIRVRIFLPPYPYGRLLGKQFDIATRLCALAPTSQILVYALAPTSQLILVHALAPTSQKLVHALAPTSPILVHALAPTSKY